MRTATRAALLLALGLSGCAVPARMGLTRIQVCVNAETGQRYDVVVPRPTRGASVCADFEASE